MTTAPSRPASVSTGGVQPPPAPLLICQAYEHLLTASRGGPARAAARYFRPPDTRMSGRLRGRYPVELGPVCRTRWRDGGKDGKPLPPERAGERRGRRLRRGMPPARG